MPQEILISEFKARCAEEIRKVRQTGRPLIVTLRGKPLVRIEPIHQDDEPAVRLGTKHGRAKIRRNLPGIDFSKDWEMEN